MMEPSERWFQCFLPFFRFLPSFRTSLLPFFKMDCAICMDTFKTATTCAACEANICRCCLEKFLLADDAVDPCCPACNKPWAATFLAEVLRPTFRKGAFKTHREKVLMDREKARLPDTQDDAARFIRAKAALEGESSRLEELRANFNKIISEGRFEAYRKCREAERKAAGATKADRKELKMLNASLREARYLVAHHGIPLPAPAAAGAGAVPAPVERRAFMMRCVRDGCDGFVSTGYKCGLCEAKICSKCHVVKSDDEHMCDPDTVATVAALKKESKPCPKCAAPISKIDGCDQMWCTLCKTAFSWNTGKVETGVVHNPHFFQYMRETGQAIPRRDLRDGCAALLQIEHVLTRLNLYGITTTDLAELHRDLLHIRHFELIRYRRFIREFEADEWRHELRVLRLAKSVDDKAWCRRLQIREKANNKHKCWAQLLDMYATSGLELLATLTFDSTAAQVGEIVAQLAALREYVDKEAQKISKLFDDVVLPVMLRPAVAAAGAGHP
jgi:hypothetical protein